jgi:hypothetical protein
LPVYIGVPANVLTPANQLTFNSIQSGAAVDNTSSVATMIKPGGQVAPALPISRPGAAGGPSDLAVGGALPPLIAPKAAPPDGGSPPTQAMNPVTRDEIKVPLSQPPPPMFLTPFAPTNDPAPSRDAMFALPPNDVKQLPFSVLAPPATGNFSLPTSRAAIPSPQTPGNIPLPVPRPVTLARPTASNIPLPIPRAATLPPPAMGNRSQLVQPAAPSSESAAIDDAEPSTQPDVQQPLPPLPPARPAPKVAAHRLLPPKPQATEPQATVCPVVNGRRVCN